MGFTALTHDQQAEAFLRLLRERKKPIKVGGGTYEAILTWLGLPLTITEKTRRDISTECCAAFGLQETQLQDEVTSRQLKRLTVQNGEDPTTVSAPEFQSSVRAKMQEAQRREDELMELLPKEGFFEHYTRYTLESEAPLSYHLFCAIAGLAATVNRRVFLDMGNHKLYPPFGVFILGNSGIKKTSAADIIVSLLRESALTPIYAEKLTPEALIDGMRNGNATGLVYAPEMTVLLSKQKYMESIIPLLTRFMDSPDLWNSGTILRGKAELRDVAITCIMCSTIDWFTKNTPEALFGGGFIARNVMVMQEYSCRLKPLPPAENPELRRTLLIDLARLYELQGEVTLAPETRQAHINWYTWNKMEHVATSELFETYFARKPAHLLRIAMCLHLGTHWDLVICKDCWERAKSILEWVESHFDLLGGKMFKSNYGEEQDLVIRALERLGGEASWAELLRRMSYRMPANQLRVIISNLKEQGLIEEHNTALGHRVLLKPQRNGKGN
jgi:hypothetical protein